MHGYTPDGETNISGDLNTKGFSVTTQTRLASAFRVVGGQVRAESNSTHPLPFVCGILQSLPLCAHFLILSTTSILRL